MSDLIAKPVCKRVACDIRRLLLPALVKLPPTMPLTADATARPHHRLRFSVLALSMA